MIQGSCTMGVLKFDCMAKRLRSIVGMTLILGIQMVCVAQDLTVHVVTDSSHSKPVSGVSVQLFPQPAMRGRRKVIDQKCDSNGVVVFHNIDLSSVAWSVSIYNLGTTATDPVVILCRSENASSQGIRQTVTNEAPPPQKK